MEMTTSQIAAELRAKLKEIFPDKQVILHIRHPKLIRGWLAGPNITEKDELAFNYAIKGHININYVGKVSTPNETIVFK